MKRKIFRKHPKLAYYNRANKTLRIRSLFRETRPLKGKQTPGLKARPRKIFRRGKANRKSALHTCKKTHHTCTGRIIIRVCRRDESAVEIKTESKRREKRPII